MRLRERRSSKELRDLLGIEQDISEMVRKSRLRWYGHVMRREESAGMKRALEFEVEGKLGRGRSKLVGRPGG